ncbi:SDR family NAD(P)-dependent oxidoreductase [Kitasatospora sp. NPDC047058]|uniref:SDR family NAD(P)-dependent oxidoreductase n=1 Tax=Kitasatospora sp. NPDC047058 TaxID=3155620 RepID=UPI0033C48F46
MNLNGKRILVTGGTSGVGLALAEALTAAGARVAVCGRRVAADGPQLLGGTPLTAFAADLSVPGEATRLAGRAVAALGGLDVVVANAGVQHLGDLTRGPAPEVLARAEEEIAVNLRSVVELATASWPHLAAAGAEGGAAAFVAATSGLAYAPKRTAPVYCATKAAVHTLLQALRYQAERGTPAVRVQEVVLPLVDTPMTAGREGATRKIPASAAAGAVLRGIERGRPVIPVGASRTLLALLRLHPRTAYRILRDS